MYDRCDAYESSADPTSDSNAALRRSLRSLWSPVPSEDFDARVLERLASPEPWWRQLRTLCRALKPAFAAAAGAIPLASLVITLIGQSPVALSNSGASGPALSAGSLPVDQALDRPDLSPMTLRRLSREEANVRGRSGRTISVHRAV